MNLFLLIDISGSMSGHKIGAVTEAMENLLSELSDEDIQISILLFSRTTTWMIENPIPIEDVKWEEPECNGMTSTGKACKELASKLHGISKEEQNVFLLISDGCPTDDFEDGLNSLLELTAFSQGYRRAIAIGSDADLSSLSQFTGNPQYMVKVEDLEYLLQAILTLVDVEDFNQPKDKKTKERLANNYDTSSIVEEDEWA